MPSDHTAFHLHEPKFVLDLEDRLLDRRTHHREANDPHPRLVPPIPDLRFEYSYLKSIQPYVKIKKTIPDPVQVQEDVESEASDDRSYEKVELSGHLPLDGSSQNKVFTAAVVSNPAESIEIQWGKVLWITTRDQVISPLIQGALWAIASSYITPLTWGFGAKLGGSVRERLPPKEGGVVTWLRGLFASKPSKSRP